MEHYAGILFFIGLIVWLVIGVHMAARFHWCFGLGIAGNKSARRLHFLIFWINTIFWPWLLIYQAYCLFQVLRGR